VVVEAVVATIDPRFPLTLLALLLGVLVVLVVVDGEVPNWVQLQPNQILLVLRILVVVVEAVMSILHLLVPRVVLVVSSSGG